MTSIYKKGARKEYKIVEDLRKLGYEIVQRTAGSHSRIDIIAIDLKNKYIKLIQSKRTLSKNIDYIDPKLKNKIEEDNKDLNGLFNVEFEVK
jgi:Holliday junction resolvase